MFHCNKNIADIEKFITAQIEKTECDYNRKSKIKNLNFERKIYHISLMSLKNKFFNEHNLVFSCFIGIEAGLLTSYLKILWIIEMS